jgi:hypothetical protein
MKLILLFLISFPVFSKTPTECLPRMDQESFDSLVFETKSLFFSELDHINLKVTTFRSESYFLQTQPSIKTLINKKQKRIYTVQLNLNLLDCPPPLKALEAILVHELEHVKDYETWSSTKIMSHGGKYISSCKFKTAYERKTDRKVLEKGLHEGLAEYREWVYQWLTPKALANKRKIYLTPEEIRNQIH